MDDGDRGGHEAAISYLLRFPEAAQHRVEVEARYPTGGAESVTLMMPVWTPGSYLVREFARHVETLAAAAADGSPLAVDKVAKNRWRVATGGGAEVVVRYRLYCREMGVRSNFVDASFALLNGAPTFLTLLDGSTGAPARLRHRVRLVTPEDWATVVSPLPEVDRAYVAADYDELVDSPLYAGNGRVDSFTVDDGRGGGAEFVIVHEGGGEVWDAGWANRDARRVAEAELALWGSFPFRRYVTFNFIVEGRGGLEHRDSTVLMTSRWRATTAEGRRGWLSLFAHELFHAWNGKRLRPAALGPFDYERESYTSSLWFVEGVTSYYDDLLVHRAGLSTRDEYLEALGDVVEEVETTPGRAVQPLVDSSFDAWIKFYRRDENTVNSGVSYYRKGALVAWLLDARIRTASGGERCLDDLMRAAYERWSGADGFTPEELRTLVAQVGGAETADWLAAALTDTGDFDYAPALNGFGLRFTAKKKKDGEEAGGSGAEADGSGGDEPAAWLGAGVETRDGRLVVTEVRRGTPAWEAGVNVEDELVAVDDYRLPAGGLDDRLESYRPGDEASLLVARRERLLRLPVVFGERPEPEWRPAVDPDAGEAAAARREAWLGGARPGQTEGRQVGAHSMPRRVTR